MKDKKNNAVPDYTRRAISKYQQKFKRVHVALTYEIFAIFEDMYQSDISFGKFVNDTVEMLLESKEKSCGFGPGNVLSSDIIRKDVNIPKEMEALIMDKYSDSILGNTHRWVSFSGIVSWAVTQRLRNSFDNRERGSENGVY